MSKPEYNSIYLSKMNREKRKEKKRMAHVNK